MRRISVILIALMAAVVFTAAVYAAEERAASVTRVDAGKAEIVKEEVMAEKVITGSVVSIDAEKGTVVIRNDATGKDRTLAASKEAIAALKVGEKVRVTVIADVTVKELIKVVEKK
jgi:hypothetical protein